MNLLQAYKQACATGDWHYDTQQQQSVCAIAPVLETWQQKPSRWRVTKPKVQWLYLWGPSGTGKTKLMNLVCECLPKTRTLRMHFIPFMAYVETMLAEFGAHDSACAQVVERLYKKGTDIICLDEFYVDNITDAMVLGRLLEAAQAHHLMFFFTSNATPDALYPNGLQRDRFLRTIARIEQNALVYELTTDNDYRHSFVIDEQLDTLRALPASTLTHALATYFTIQDELVINGRQVPHRGMRHECIWFCFADLCETAQHASDYRDLVQRYTLIVITDVPVLQKDDAVRRFITLIDILYDNQVACLLFTADACPDWQALYQHTGLKRVFMRTASRLQEMQSAAYLQASSDYIQLIYSTARNL